MQSFAPSCDGSADQAPGGFRGVDDRTARGPKAADLALHADGRRLDDNGDGALCAARSSETVFLRLTIPAIKLQVDLRGTASVTGICLPDDRGRSCA